MEQIVAPVSAFTRRCRSLAVSHVEQGLARGLDPAEHVIVLDPGTNEHYTAVVADVTFEATDTGYRLELGTRITAAEAADWLSPTSHEDQLTTRDIVDLLAELRRGERDIALALANIRAHS